MAGHSYGTRLAAIGRIVGAACLAFLVVVPLASADERVSRPNESPAGRTYLVGAAELDISPPFPVRLSGYAVRTTESEAIEDPIFARALSVADGENASPAVLITVDTCILSQAIRDEIAERIEADHKIPSDRVTIKASHSHTTPMLAGTIPNMFGQEIPAEHAERIDRYTRLLIDRCVEVAGKAFENRVPCTLQRGEGMTGFAANRRQAAVRRTMPCRSCVPAVLTAAFTPSLPAMPVTAQHWAVTSIVFLPTGRVTLPRPCRLAIPNRSCW